MIKVIFCLKRQPQLSREEFQRYWREQHAPLVKRHAAALGMLRYVQSHTLNAPRLAVFAQMRGSADREFDGVTEIWWDSADALLAAVVTAEGQVASGALLEDEARFVDLPNSPVFFSEEFEVFA